MIPEQNRRQPFERILFYAVQQPSLDTRWRHVIIVTLRHPSLNNKVTSGGPQQLFLAHKRKYSKHGHNRV